MQLQIFETYLPACRKLLIADIMAAAFSSVFPPAAAVLPLSGGGGSRVDSRRSKLRLARSVGGGNTNSRVPNPNYVVPLDKSFSSSYSFFITKPSSPANSLITWYHSKRMLRCYAAAGSRPSPLFRGRVQLTIMNNPKAPLEEHKQKMLLELAEGDSTKDRPGLDLVAVLDVSASMKSEDIEKLKTAMLFVIRKLSSIDRLSIVTFSENAKLFCQLQQITETSRLELENMIKGLVADGGVAKIANGLKTGLKVLTDRKHNGGRVVAIMLLSGGKHNSGNVAAQVDLGSVPVHTFGFGANYDPMVLKDIADKSIGGTFSDVQNKDNLSKAFSMCLAGLLSVLVQDLNLTVTRIKDESTIEQVSAGNYPQTKDDSVGSVTISLGDLYSKEVRKIIVDLLLPKIDKARGADMLWIYHSYNTTTGGKRFEAPPAKLSVYRSSETTSDLVTQKYKPKEMVPEETCLEIANMIKEVRTMADDKKLDNAKDTLRKAQNSLQNVTGEANPLVKMMETELEQLENLMKTQDVYEKQGRSFALSFETSLNRQRFAARDNLDNLRVFSTPRMVKFLEHAKKFNEDPNQPLPSVEEDVLEEIVSKSLAPTAEALSFYHQAAIQALQSTEKIINKSVCNENPSQPLASVKEDVKEEIAKNPLAHTVEALSFYYEAAIQALQSSKKIINKGV